MGDAAAFWSANNPSVMTVRAFRRKTGDEAEHTKRDIRLGGSMGAGLAILVGFGGSLVTKNWLPVTGALAMVALQFGVWEWAMANPHGTAMENIATQTTGRGPESRGTVR